MIPECHSERMNDFYILTLNHGFGSHKTKCGRQDQVSVHSIRPLLFIVIAQVLAQPAVLKEP